MKNLTIVAFLLVGCGANLEVETDPTAQCNFSSDRSPEVSLAATSQILTGSSKRTMLFAKVMDDELVHAIVIKRVHAESVTVDVDGREHVIACAAGFDESTCETTSEVFASIASGGEIKVELNGERGVLQANTPGCVAKVLRAF